MAKYNPKTETLDRNQRNFTYHKPIEGQAERYTELRQKAGEFANHLLYSCPESRELSLALTKIEEAVFWANAAIARNEKGE